MKKNNLYITLTLLISIASYFILTKEMSPQDVISNKKEVTNNSNFEIRKSIKSIRYTKNMNLTSKIFPEVCSESFINLNGMIPAEYIEIIKSKASLESFFSNTCLEALKNNKVFNHLAKDSDCNILEPNFKFTEEKLNGSCSTLLFTLKAYSIAEQAQNIPISQMTSQELAANFVKMFFSFDLLNKDTFNQNMELLNQFYEMHKDDPSVVEAYLGYIMIAQQITGEKLYSSNLDNILSNQEGGSFKVDRLAVIKEVINNDMSKAKETLERLNSHYSKEAELQYYYAAYYWKKNNRSMANTYLEKAITMSKNCSYCVPSLYINTKKRMAKAEYGDKQLFSISIGLSFDSL